MLREFQWQQKGTMLTLFSGPAQTSDTLNPAESCSERHLWNRCVWLGLCLHSPGRTRWCPFVTLYSAFFSSCPARQNLIQPDWKWIKTLVMNIKCSWLKCLIWVKDWLDNPVFLWLGLKGWEKRLVISDRAHIGMIYMNKAEIIFYFEMMKWWCRISSVFSVSVWLPSGGGWNARSAETSTGRQKVSKGEDD